MCTMVILEHKSAIKEKLSLKCKTLLVLQQLLNDIRRIVDQITINVSRDIVFRIPTSWKIEDLRIIYIYTYIYIFLYMYTHHFGEQNNRYKFQVYIKRLMGISYCKQRSAKSFHLYHIYNTFLWCKNSFSTQYHNVCFVQDAVFCIKIISIQCIFQ